ncbi:uncharacterized protein LOC105762191 [Gossypium raimondii]|uniref:uncharacterized protein LOC105762191 n=1 Tax=Gossypium raimondii TaxID=29730 RepID=UPI00063AF613|nr:uncharacterized protein LOC105762191 [Gossypium raimondii]
MIAKSREEREHVGSLKKLFERLRKFQLKLNSAKCTFGATSEKLLSFIVSEREKEGESSKEKSWKMSFDGVSNALGHRIRAVLVSLEGDHYPLTARLNFFYTNNIAKYEACIMGFRATIRRKIKSLEVHGDSALVIYQIRGDWEVRDLKLVKYHDLVAELIKEFYEVTFNYFPREENQLADALATLSSMFKANKKLR